MADTTPAPAKQTLSDIADKLAIRPSEAVKAAVHQDATTGPTADTVRAFDPKTGLSFRVPKDAAEGMWRSGQIGFKDDQEIPVKLSDGGLGVSRVGQLAEVLNSGASIAGEGEFKKADIKARVDNSLGLAAAPAAFGIGAIRGLGDTIGMGDFTNLLAADATARLTGTSQQSQLENFESLGEEHPVASFLGQAGGSVLGIEGSGLGALSRGLGAASTSGIASPALGKIAAAGVDATAMMAPSTVTSAARSTLDENPDLSGEKLAAAFAGQVLSHSALNFGIGAGFGAASVGLGKLKGLRNISGERAIEEKAAANLGLKPEEARVVARDYQNQGEIKQAVVKEATESADRVLKASEAIREGTTGQFKKEAVRKMIAPMSAESGEALLSNARQLREGLESLQGEDFFGVNKQVLARDIKLLAKHEETLVKAIESADHATAYHVADDMKRVVGEFNNGLSGTLRKTQDSAMLRGGQAQLDVSRNLYEQARTLLEDETIFGKMGMAQRRANAAITENIPAIKELRGTFGRAREIPGAYGEKTFDADPGKVSSWLNGLGKEDAALTTQRVKDSIASAKNLAQTLDEIGYELPEEAKKAVKELIGHTEKFGASVSGFEQRISRINQFEEALKRENEAGEVFGGVTKYALGALGWATGGLLGPLGVGGASMTLESKLRPMNAALKLVQLERAVESINNRTVRSIGRMILGTKPKPAPAVAAQSVAKDFEKSAGAIAKAASVPPDQLSEQFAKRFGGAELVNTRAADALTATTVKGVYFLSSKLPPANNQIDPLGVTKAFGWKASPLQMQKWLRYAKAVKDPLSVVDGLSDGTLTPEGVEVLQQVYPALYNDVRTKVMAQIQAKPREYSKQERIRLGLLLGLETDPSLRKASVAASQATFAQMAEEKKNAAPRPTQGGSIAKIQALETRTTSLEKAGGT